MGTNVKRQKSNRAKPDRARPADQGRLAQRNRTRKAIIDATMQLIAVGRTPSMTDIIRAAEVSRRTIYMYFPTVEQLLLDATLGVLSQNRIDQVISTSASGDAGMRIEQLSRSVNALSGKTMHLGRALIRLTVEGNEPRSGGPRRGYRRVEWIARTLESVRTSLTAEEFERLVSALSVLMGWEPLIILEDIRGLGQKEAENVLAFAARALVDATLRARR
jgi:AcrR family transcriptional regulator